MSLEQLGNQHLEDLDVYLYRFLSPQKNISSSADAAVLGNTQ